MKNDSSKIMDKKITVSIGIPAYNEEANIAFLLDDVLKQQQKSFELEQIIVYSDGSCDRTEELIKSFSDPRIKLISGKKRRGVSYGINTILSQISSSIAVVLNADLSLVGTDFLEHLIAPIVEKKADLTSASLQPLPPKTFFEKVLFAGTEYKNSVFKEWRSSQNLYNCHGTARGFSKNLYQSLYFPSSVGEDMYSYLYCLSRDFNFVYTPQAITLYKLPDNFRDHFQQSTRFFLSAERLFEEFGKDKVLAQTRLPKILLMSQAIKFFFRYPFQLFLYNVITVITSMAALASGLRLNQTVKEEWTIAASSKILRH